MGYNNLSESGMTGIDRWQEAVRILGIIKGAKLTIREQTFVNGLNQGSGLTTKQLFWLRDIKDRFLDQE